MTLKIYNVLTRTKEEFKPLQPGKANIYVCGPTVYDYSHIGHAKTYVGFDVVVRYLRYLGYDVLYVQNITDVGHMLDTGEDRILKKARQLSAGPMQIVETYMREYFADMDALGVQRPDISPRASGHVPEQIEMVQTLIAKGNAYESEGSVYFDVTSFPEYGKLSGRVLEEQEEGSREAVRSEKRHPADFALWKKADPEHILRWPSPWSDGFPGWHVECSAMANKYLGTTFDIHGGGIDNIFPHNECEIAQSEAAHGETFARYWMLTGSLTLDGVKMSKSLGNTLTIKDALARWRPEAIRTFILSSHYGSPIDFSDEAIEAAYKGWQRMWGAVTLARQQLRTAVPGAANPDVIALLDKAKAQFIEKMNDDFNAPAALGVLQELTRQVNILLNEQGPHTNGTLTAVDNLYRELGGGVLGIIPDEADGGSSGSAEREDGLVQILIKLRAQARANRDWATSDAIRNQLKDLGVVLEDRADGTIWKTE
ncbi:MAG: cysteine--tRNA ligase [Ardenticatenaceae bacterium]|nr:cysteine--tRNA ligase [Anaerolineales bacterium]MCB8921242.1 cysteine--tRNA ligase [Ardenticatenaceae bacterium]MCB8990608.1 cysteine--tRNA ligase [Ardenticatenaceae bacterium]MCB9004315.1 cysteine--tRNA ligase [Ardenticatenaceae bacterium]